MTPRQTGAAVLGIHLGMVLAIAAKYELDVWRLPRAWSQAEWSSVSNTSGRSRYVMLEACPMRGLENHLAPSFPVRLRISGSYLLAEPGGKGDRVRATTFPGGKLCLSESTEFYVPPETSLPPPGTELWVEFSVPENAPPRPLRLGTKQNGQVRELKP